MTFRTMYGQEPKRNEHPTLPQSKTKKLKPTTDEFIQPQKQLIIPSFDEMIKNPPKNPTRITLNISEYRKWNVKQVASVLIADDSDGGCNLSVTKVKLLVDVDFDGLSLHNIVKDLNRKTGDEDAVQELERIYNKHDTPQLSSTIKSIVFWVRDNLCNTNIHVDSLTLSQPKITEVNYTPDNYDEIDRKYIQKSSFQPEELLYLHNLKQYNLKDLNAPFFSTLDPLCFKLKHRDETIKQITDVGTAHYNLIPLDTVGKQKFNFFIAKGGSGSGKTRILTEIPKFLRESEIDSIFENTKIIYFNFANGFSLEEGERDNKSISMIVSRIVYAAFERPTNLVKNTPPSENDCFLYEVMRIISEKLHEIYGEITIPLVLAFDEYQLATRANSRLHTSIQHKLGWYMRKVQNRHKILLFPAFGGTLSESDVKMEPAQYTPSFLRLPSFRPIDIEQIMNEMGLSTHYYGNYKEFWNIIGIIPRHLEWAIGNDIDSFKSIILDESTVQSTVYTKVSSIVLKQYFSNFDDSYFVELALKTISGLKYEKDEKLTKYISEGKVYDDNNGFIGVPLVVIDVLSTKVDYIPKRVVSDFITVSNKPLWERFEELCLKTMTARLNVLYSLRRTEKILFSELFKGAHFKTNLGFCSLKTNNASWFKYECLQQTIDRKKEEENEDILDDTCVSKAKKNQDDVDGVLCPLFYTNNKRVVFVTQNKFQYEESQNRTLEPSDIITYYQNAVKTPFKSTDTFVIIFTNKKVSDNTKKMLKKGKITRTIKQKKETIDTDRLIVVSGDCFHEFFHPFIANILT